MTPVPPGLRNNLLIRSPSEMDVGRGGVAVGRGVAPNGVAVPIMTSGGGKSEVGVLIASTVATIDGGAASPSSGPGVLFDPISSALGPEVSSPSVSEESSSSSSGSGVLVGVLVGVGVLIGVIVLGGVIVLVGVTVAGGVQGPMRLQISAP